MALPRLTPEQRQANLEKAAASRRERAEIKNRLKHSGASIVDVLQQGQENEVIGKMRVVDLLQSMPGPRQGPRPADDGAAQHLREPPGPRARRQPDRRARARVRVAGLTGDVDVAGRLTVLAGPDRGRQGHGRGDVREPPSRGLDLGLGDHPAAPARARCTAGTTGSSPTRSSTGWSPTTSCSSGRWCTSGARYGTPRRPVEEALAAGPARAAGDRPPGRPAGARADARGAVRVPQAAVLGGAGAPAGRPGHRDRGGADPPAGDRAARSWPPRRSST